MIIWGRQSDFGQVLHLFQNPTDEDVDIKTYAGHETFVRITL